jgi:hypothetical protein
LDYDAKIAIVFMSKLDIKKYKPPWKFHHKHTTQGVPNIPLFNFDRIYDTKQKNSILI